MNRDENDSFSSFSLLVNADDKLFVWFSSNAGKLDIVLFKLHFVDLCKKEVR